MSDMIAWIAAEAERPEIGEGIEFGRKRSRESESREQRDPQREKLPPLPAHQFQASATVETGRTLSEQELLHALCDCDQERRVYRGRTCAMLRRYMRYSLETGQLPSLVGREFFRSKVTKYRVTTFEDRVIFVHDMETCLQRLDEFSREVLGRVVLQEYEHEEAARLLGCTRMTVHRNLLEALDGLIEILLEVGLLDALPARAEKSCQEGKEVDFFASDCEQGK